MKTSTSRRPSPAVVISVLALICAMAGTALAGSDTFSKLTKSKVKSIARTQIAKAAPKLSVAKATTADKATSADNATTATNAASADRAVSANTIAYGMFTESGDLAEDDRGKNLTTANVTHPAAGVYCFGSLGFTPKSVMVAADNGFGFEDTLVSARIATPPGGTLNPCPGTEPVRIKTWDVSSAALADRAFLIWFQD